MHLLRAISSGLAVLVCLCGSGAVVAQDDSLYDSLRLEAQPLSEALIDFSEQTGLQIGYATELAEGKMGQAVEDIAEPRAALAALLKNSGLEYQFVNEGTVVIRAAAARAGTGKAATREKRSPSVEPLLMAQLQPEGKQGGNDEDDEDAGDEAQSEETDPLALGELRVTGSRLIRGDPTARVITITAAQIKAMGVSNVEELVRTLPWAYPSNTTQTTAQPADSASSDSGDRGFGALALGISTINLRALGSQNTLVLLNGRRLAGVAGKQPNIANILSLPLSAIERVEIQLDGGSAVYGADAIGGLINFITKKDYQGLSSTVRHEFSATDSDRTQVDLHGGYAWGSGSVSGTLSRNRSRAIEHSTFWTTRDYREQFGPEYDLRFTDGQPGTVCRWNGSYFFVWCSGVYRRLPEEHSGVDATPEDFLHYPDGWPWLTDFVRPQNGEDSTHDSLTLRV